MRKTCSALALAALLAAAPRAQGADPGAGALIGLADGRAVWGKVLAHDEEGLDVARIDTGGRVRLPWDLLDERFERELRERFGYLDVAGEEVLVQADLLRTLDGREVVGLVVQHTEDAIHLKTANALLAIPKGLVAGPSVLVRVPALDVYTKDELYQRELAQRGAALAAAGAEGARAHFDLAQACERVLDFARAAEHYRRAAELAPDFRPSDTAASLARAERKAAAQEQVDFLAEVRRERRRGNYEHALAMTAAFPELFPGSPLLAELRDVQRGVERARRADLVAAAERRFLHHAERLVGAAVRELGFAEAKTFVEERLGEEALAAALVDLRAIDPDLAPEGVRALWLERAPRGSRRASYGVGTWLLGDERARAGLEEEDDAKRAKSEREAARDDLEERVRRFLEGQRTSSRARSSADAVDPEAFWRDWTNAGRAQWLTAYWAEFGGVVEVVGTHLRACSECGGTGVREVTYAGPGVSGVSRERTQRIPCPTCQHVGIVRRVTYR